MKPYPAILATALLSAPAFAHGGHGEDGGAIGGLLHPLTGVDHVAAMLMIGLWAGLSAGRCGWLAPAAFLAGMAGGFLFGLTGGSFPLAEPLILASLIGLAGALAFGVPAAAPWAVTVAALFGAAHGFAHGSEMPAAGQAVDFAAGLFIATAALNAIGFAIVRRVSRGITPRRLIAQSGRWSSRP